MRLSSFQFAAIVLVTLLGATAFAQQPAAPTITTTSPLPPGTVGAAYAVTLQASGGTLPLAWQLAGGTLPQGLGLAQAGTISGNPSSVGTFNVLIRVIDADGRAAQRGFSITIDPRGLTIQNDAVLPRARVGVPYLEQLAAVGGTSPYRNWRVTEGQLPQGIALLPVTGQLNGSPTAFGTFRFTVMVDDSAFETASKQFTLFVDPANITITTQSPLPLATLGTAYSQTLEASGGPPPHRWSAQGLPDGLTVSEAGAISGTPSAVGVFQVAAQVTDASDASAMRTLALTVADPRATITLEGEQAPLGQPAMHLAMTTAHPFAIAGQIELSFQPAAVNNSDDQAVQFSNGLRTAQFTIPANSTDAAFTAGDLGLMVGTTAGVLTLRVTALQAGSQAIPPPAESSLDLTIAQSAPVITEASIATRTATGVTLQIAGYSTPRQVTRAVFRFTPIAGRTLQNSQVTVELTEASNGWYQNPLSSATGSLFLYMQPFTIQGDINAVQSVAITVTNSVGDSQQSTVSF
jgi:hypothetical protein